MRSIKMLAIDLGASSGRGMIGELQDERLILREIHRFSNDPLIVCGQMQWDILRIFYEIKQAVSKAILEGGVATLGIDTWGVDYALLDQNGKMLANPIHYRDLRTANAKCELEQHLSFEELYGITGIQHMNCNTVYQLMSDLRDSPALFDLAEHFLNIPDLLNYFLTGKQANEYTILSTGALLDAEKRQYATELLQALGIPTRLFGKITEPGTVLGSLTPQLQAELGKSEMKVVNVASHDTASAVLSVPSTEESFLYISSGTWSLMGTELDAPRTDPASRKANITNEGGAMGKIRYLKNIMGLWLIQESRRQWKREGKEYSFFELECLAKECTPFRSLINPDDELFTPPGDMPARVREFCRKTGQPVPETVGEVIRCIYESLALKYRMTAETLCNLIQKQLPTIHIVGGGAKDHFLCQLTADACDLQVLAGPEEATAIGNLMMQAIAMGRVRDLSHARKIVARSFPIKTYEPTPDREAWEAAYARFCKLN